MVLALHLNHPETVIVNHWAGDNGVGPSPKPPGKQLSSTTGPVTMVLALHLNHPETVIAQHWAGDNGVGPSPKPPGNSYRPPLGR